MLMGANILRERVFDSDFCFFEWLLIAAETTC